MSKYLIWHPLVKRIQNLFKSFVISNHTDHTGKCFHHFSHLKVYDSVLYHAASHHAIRVPQPLQLKVEVPGLTLRSVLVRGGDPELPELSMKFVDVCWLRTVQTCSRSSHTYGLRSCCAFISWQIEIRSAFYCVQWSDLILLLLDQWDAKARIPQRRCSSMTGARSAYTQQLGFPRPFMPLVCSF